MTGLLTFTDADNYGALLQAYALQQTLKMLGHDSEFLCFSSGKAASATDFSRLPAVIRRKMEETQKYHRERSSLFDDFRKNALKISSPVSREEASRLNDKYERFIVGSDQVWNYGLTGGDLLYALPFADAEKRFSYAASFGGEEGVGKATERFWKELSLFQRISLREDDGADICRDKTGILPRVHLDPCLLLPKEKWESLLPDGKTADGGVFLFLIEYDADFCRQAQDFAEQRHLPLHVVTASYFPQFGYECFARTGVTDWMERIYNAEYVFCDSYHAMIFSILFGKPFMLKMSKAKLAGRSGRLQHLLNLFSLHPNRLENPVSVAAADDILGPEREKALGYLKEIYE